MYGGKDNDIYYIDGLDDEVIELAKEGHDKVYSSISYTLRDNVEDLELTGSATYGAGNSLQNHLIGNNYDNTLDGRGGADTMEGGRGNDYYYVDVAGDEVIERAGEGTDLVISSADSYTLRANVENLRLSDVPAILGGPGPFGGSVARNGTGNQLDNEIRGNSINNELRGEGGRDTLDGGEGADIMRGGTEHDTYIVDNVDDQVIENAGEGSDLVKSWIDYTLGANVENLILLPENARPEGSIEGSYNHGPISGTGNALNNSIVGNARDNVLRGEQGNDDLDGGLGADDMYGGRDDDFYHVDNVGDEVFEFQNEGYDIVVSEVSYALSNHVEELNLVGDTAANATGNNLSNFIFGNAFANVIDGHGGSDTLFGGWDADTFVFNHINQGGQQDVVMDFQPGVDRIDLINTPVQDYNDLFTPGERYMEQLGTDVLIHTSGSTSILLQNVQMSSLTAADFLF
jgi:Ca2+-binding RTX toxin-like protein